MIKAVDIAYETIRDGIRDGTYPPGSHLTAQALAEASGFSRTPVREAMRRLHAEALIHFIPNRGAFVATWSRLEIEQIYDLRILLESFAASEAATHISDEQLAELRRIALRMHEITQEAEPNVETVTELNDDFHKLILDASGNVRLRNLLGSIVENSSRAEYVSVLLGRSNSPIFSTAPRARRCVCRARSGVGIRDHDSAHSFGAADPDEQHQRRVCRSRRER